MIQTVNIFTHGPHDSLGLLPQALQQMGVAYHVVDVSDLSQDLPHVADVAWAVFLGSPESAYDDDLPWLAREISYLQMLYQAQVPILGICFGSQVLARSLGGTVKLNSEFEYAWVTLNEEAQQLGLPRGPWFAFHFDAFTPPAQATVLGKSDLAHQAYVCGNAMGVQFHPEISIEMFDSWLEHWQQTAAGGHFVTQHLADITEIKAMLQAAQTEHLCHLTALLNGFVGMVSTAQIK